jgi:hypothetical protein
VEDKHVGYRHLVGEVFKEEKVGRIKRKWENNIKMVFGEVWCEGIQLAENSVQ